MRALCLLLVAASLVAGCGGSEEPPAPPGGGEGPPMAAGGSPDECLAKAAEKLEALVAEGVSGAELDQQYQQALAICLLGEADTGVACTVAAANVEYARLARLFVAGEILAPDYVALVRDRSRKQRRARSDPAWQLDCVEGDSDADLVPDALDQCPESPRDTPTGDDGCPEKEDRPPQGPEDELVRPLLEQFGFLHSPACEGAPLPTVPKPVKFGYNNVDRSTVNFAVLPVLNQPADCLVFYEIRVRLINKVNPALPDVAYVTMLFRDWEDTEPDGSWRRVFRVSESDSGMRRAIFDDWKFFGDAHWRARAVNGNGLSSPWSALTLQQAVSFGEP